ncbi:MAG: hypothetical protein LWW85_14520 [Marinilabiliales bacterium]|nr:hypothetical protein [Marinilabiliales bacterium]
MNGYDENRRRFLSRIGLSLGLALSGEVIAPEAKAGVLVAEKLTVEQEEFLITYRDWMKGFKEVIELRKTEPDDLGHNKRLMALAEEAKAFREQLMEYMKEEPFARRFMVITEEMTLMI